MRYSAGGVRKYYFFCIYANIFSKSLHFPRIHPKIPLAPAHFAIFMDWYTCWHLVIIDSHIYFLFLRSQNTSIFLRFKRFWDFEEKFAILNFLKKVVYLRSERFSQNSRSNPIVYVEDFSYLCRHFLCVYARQQQNRKQKLKAIQQWKNWINK